MKIQFMLLFLREKPIKHAEPTFVYDTNKRRTINDEMPKFTQRKKNRSSMAAVSSIILAVATMRLLHALQ